MKTGLPGTSTSRSSSSPTPSGVATIKVLLMPLMLWLWIGGAVMALGTLLAAFPGRRRRPTDPVSAPIADEPARAPEPDPDPDLVGVSRRQRSMRRADG